MKAIVVYGCPCSGKSTYVKSAMGDCDVVFDYGRLLMALTTKDNHTADKHPAHGLLMQLRRAIISSLKNDQEVQQAFIITRWPTDALKDMLEGFAVEYKYIQTSEKECLERLAGDDRRPDKEQWKTIIHIVVRSIGKYIGSYGSCALTGCDEKIKKHLGITLLPQAGVALGMAITAESLADGAVVRSVVLFSVLIYELVGPALTKRSLLAAGEINPEGQTSARKKNR